MNPSDVKKVLWSARGWTITYHECCECYFCEDEDNLFVSRGPAMVLTNNRMTKRYHLHRFLRNRSGFDCLVLAFRQIQKTEMARITAQQQAELLTEEANALADIIPTFATMEYL